MSDIEAELRAEIERLKEENAQQRFVLDIMSSDDDEGLRRENVSLRAEVRAERARCIRIIESEKNYPRTMIEELGFWRALWVWWRFTTGPTRFMRASWSSTAKRLIAQIEAEGIR